MTVCYIKGKEKGAWYDLKTMRDTIALIEARGGDASFEKELIRAWLKIPEYQAAEKDNIKRGLYNTSLLVGNRQNAVTKPRHKEITLPVNVTAPAPPLSTVTPGCVALSKRIEELASQGKSCRAIADILNGEDIKISHMSVARKLQGVLV